MKFARLRKKLIILSGVLAVLIFGGSALSYYLSSTLEEGDSKIKGLQVDKANLNNQITTLEKKSREISEAAKLWQQLNSKHKKREGLKIDTAKKILDDLKRQYKLSALEINLSSPVELADIYKTETTVVVSSNVTINFKGISDEYVLSFIDALIDDFPGYVKVDSLTLSRVGTVSNEYLFRISKGDLPEMVSGEMKFQWRDLKDVTPKKADAPVEKKP